ncbi:pre-toxin TG domain-containing protein, partial [Candidatus Azambacteria bacterium]|nr:pre-toxin TG domain-containing protein [Candidatus Azambacteria bacterium]
AQSLDDQAYLNNFKVAEKSLNDLKLEEGKKLAEKQVELVKMEKFKKDKEEMRETAKTLTSIFISLPPVIGEGYDTLTLFQGKDPITGEKLTSFTKTLTILGLASGVGSEYFIHFI